LTAARIVDTWVRNDAGWSSPPYLSPRHRQVVLAVANSSRLPQSGRMMWNLGMWCDVYFQELQEADQKAVLRAIEATMLSSRNASAYGMWKLGDCLGESIGTYRARRILERVAQNAAFEAGRLSAMHGLVHYAYNHPRSRKAIAGLLDSCPADVAKT